MLSLLESNKTQIKDFKKFGDIFSRYYKVIRGELTSYTLEDIELLMSDIRILRGKQGFKQIFNHCKNTMLKKIRKIHIEKIRDHNKKNQFVIIFFFSIQSIFII